jgi:hypothetical protein
MHDFSVSDFELSLERRDENMRQCWRVNGGVKTEEDRRFEIPVRDHAN